MKNDVKERKIRQRAGYKFFKNMLEELDACGHSKGKILMLICRVIDSKKGWGSNMAAMYAEESLNLLMKDKKLRS